MEEFTRDVLISIILIFGIAFFTIFMLSTIEIEIDFEGEGKIKTVTEDGYIEIESVKGYIEMKIPTIVYLIKGNEIW